MTRLEILIQTLSNLGGKAHYSEIYDEYGKIVGYNLSSKEKAAIRACIETHSSDSDEFRGNDIFYSVNGKGKGFWGLK
ncbi:MAG TPA: hypothetical protein DCQ78_06660 [Ruminococcus sp.]|nr:hypothetical protein [Ruminococcus sp.]